MGDEVDKRRADFCCPVNPKFEGVQVCKEVGRILGYWVHKGGGVILGALPRWKGDSQLLQLRGNSHHGEKFGCSIVASRKPVVRVVEVGQIRK